MCGFCYVMTSKARGVCWDMCVLVFPWARLAEWSKAPENTEVNRLVHQVLAGSNPGDIFCLPMGMVMPVVF